ncbi:hypothetical protein BT93_I0628 [Corymbia citriodora subsp. variegata]|nr:hypothetical protein BT93_I0628 [Corymbia citriodora subsp. variegata]
MRRKKEPEMAVDFAEATVEAVFGDLYSLVKDTARTVAAFRPQLKKIESTLSEMDPIIKKIYHLYEQLDRLKEMDPIKELLDEGKGLVQKCLSIHWFHLHKKYTLSSDLTEYNKAVQEKFQIYMSLLAARNDAEMLMNMEEIRSLCSSQANRGAIQSGLGAFGNLAVPAAPAFMVGSEMEKSMREIKLRLLKEGARVIVVTAPGGCGKTTLIKKLCHDREIKGKFNIIMFVTVSKKPNLTDIVQKMYQHNHLEAPEIKTEDGAFSCLEQLLHKIGQDPVLLVLDDVWAEWESILKKFVCNDIKDYKIVVTSRYEFPYFRPVHHLKPLTHDEAVELFRQCVTVDDRSVAAPDSQLLNKMVEHCKRLPLVIKVIANSLRGKDYAFWRGKLNELNEGHSLIDSDKEIEACLRKSLDDMASDPSIKERFMDLGSFPEDCKIPATALIDMWVELYKLDPDGVRAITNLHELVSRNLADLVVTRKDSSDDHESYSSHYYSGHFAQQHDLLRELAIKECKKVEMEKRERFILELNGNKLPDWWSEQKQRPLGARLLSISTDKTFSAPWPNLELPQAEVLVLNFQNDMQSKTYALPEFIEKADKLKALIVTNHSFFPAELHNFHVVGGNLRRIRFQRIAVPFLSIGKLCLHNLKKISFFMCHISQTSTSNDAKISDGMPNLVELDIDYCDNLTTLPDGICEIKPLKKLSITNCHNFSALPEQIGQLVSLEVIRLNSCTALSQLPDSIRSLQNMKLLDISDCMKLSALPNQIGEMVNLNRINMRGCLKLFGLPRSIIKLRNLRKVICEKEKADLWGLLKGTLPKLNITLFEEEPNLDWLE